MQIQWIQYNIAQLYRYVDTVEPTMPMIKYYTDAELLGLTDEQLDHLRLVSRVLDQFEHADPNELESMTDEQLRAILGDDLPPVVAQRRRPRRTRERLAPSIRVRPRTLTEAFVVVDGRVMRRLVHIIEVWQHGARVKKQIEHLKPCGARARFEGRLYSVGQIARELSGGVVPRARYKAQVREGVRVIHLGYFASAEERDAAVFAYRLGVRVK